MWSDRRLFSSHRVELFSFQVAEEEEEKGVEESPPWDVFKDFSTSLFLLSRYSTWFYNHASRLRPSVETWQFDTLTLRAVGADSSGATTTQETSNSLQTKAKAPSAQIFFSMLQQEEEEQVSTSLVVWYRIDSFRKSFTDAVSIEPSSSFLSSNKQTTE